MTDRLIPELRDWWKLWSVRLIALALAVDGLALLPLIGFLPPVVLDRVPALAIDLLQGALLIAALIARFLKQKKVRNNDAAE